MAGWGDSTWGSDTWGGTNVTDEIASYIDTIRTRKEELLNGKD